VSDGGERIVPGAARLLIRPDEAPGYVSRALELCPDLTVVGVAGPGDALATDHALKALAAVHERFPHLIKCVSTNGLLLAEKINDVTAAGVTTLTVTVNAVNPDILGRLNDGIVYKGSYLTGRRAQELLIENQLKGIGAAAAAGLTVKVNAVFAPGVNGRHVPEVAKAAAEWGASLFNIIPLIAQCGMSGEREPTCAETDALRREVEKYLPVFRHCRHCRADAVGAIGGKDHSEQIYGTRPQEAPPGRSVETFSHG
jgi:nitrogen fixation protein NifB